MSLIINKFGGGIIDSADAVRHLSEVFKKQGKESSINVFSAFGKTTNNLEKVLKNYIDEDKMGSEKVLNELKAFHTGIAHELLPGGHAVFSMIEDIFEKIQTMLEKIDEAVDKKFIYDQVVPFGEILAVTIASEYLVSVGISNKLIHATDFLKTDANFNAANVNKKATLKALQKYMDDMELNIITEGFIGFCEEGITTLGREGSDYTAGILGNLMNANKVVLWKDVPGVMDKNPKLTDNLDAKKIDFITYDDFEKHLERNAVGLVHPKTLNEVREKKIPLQVRPFWDLDSEGTIIHI